jgi:hypothetical protein
MNYGIEIIVFAFLLVGLVGSLLIVVAKCLVLAWQSMTGTDVYEEHREAQLRAEAEYENYIRDRYPEHFT